MIYGWDISLCFICSVSQHTRNILNNDWAEVVLLAVSHLTASTHLCGRQRKLNVSFGACALSPLGLLIST